MESQERLISPAEAAELLGVGVPRVRQLAQEAELTVAGWAGGGRDRRYRLGEVRQLAVRGWPGRQNRRRSR